MSKKKILFGVTGWKNSGKTRMVAGLVEEFSRRGFIVSTIKHAHHSFDVDHEGTDSYKHRHAGAKEVALVSKNRWALMHELQNEAEPPLDDIIEKLAPCDLIIIEGYKKEAHPKIEMLRKQAIKDAPLWPNDNSIIAIAAKEHPDNCPLPVLDPDDIKQVADFIVDHLKIAQKHAAE